jgi:hypothetical protein
MNALAITISLLLATSPVLANDSKAVTDLAGLPSKIETTPIDGVLPREDLRILGITIGKDRLGEVRRRLGETKVVKMRSTDGRPNSLCYRSNNVRDDTVALFEAGPLGGFETLTAITVGPASAFSDLSNCLATAKVSRATTNAGKLRLGGDIGAFAKSLKMEPGMSSVGLIELPLQKTVRRTERTTGKHLDVDISSGVVARVNNGAVKWFSVYYIESF